MNSHKFDEIAVLVGNFSSIEDPQMDKTLATLKHAKPESLDPSKKQDSSQRLGGPANALQHDEHQSDETDQGADGLGVRHSQSAAAGGAVRRQGDRSVRVSI